MADAVSPPPKRCTAQYEREGGREPGDRIVRCHLPAGHPGVHEEADTEVTWINEPAVSPPPEVSPEIPAEALHAAARAYGLKRWTYVPASYISPEYYERHIDSDAASTAAEPPFIAAAEVIFGAGVAAGRTQAAHRAADALMMASNDIKSARAGRLTATPRLMGAGDAQRVSEWLRRLSEIYRREAGLPEGQENT